MEVVGKLRARRLACLGGGGGGSQHTPQPARLLVNGSHVWDALGRPPKAT